MVGWLVGRLAKNHGVLRKGETFLGTIFCLVYASSGKPCSMVSFGTGGNDVIGSGTSGGWGSMGFSEEGYLFLPACILIIYGHIKKGIVLRKAV